MSKKYFRLPSKTDAKTGREIQSMQLQLCWCNEFKNFQHNDFTKVQRKLARRDLKAAATWIQLWRANYSTDKQ